MIGTGGSSNGDKPGFGLQGAEAVSHLNGGQGPGEQTAVREVRRGIPRSPTRERIYGATL